MNHVEQECMRKFRSLGLPVSNQTFQSLLPSEYWNEIEAAVKLDTSQMSYQAVEEARWHAYNKAFSYLKAFFAVKDLIAGLNNKNANPHIWQAWRDVIEKSSIEDCKLLQHELLNTIMCDINNKT